VPLTRTPVLVVKPKAPSTAWDIYEAGVKPNANEPY